MCLRWVPWAGGRRQCHTPYWWAGEARDVCSPQEVVAGAVSLEGQCKAGSCGDGHLPPRVGVAEEGLADRMVQVLFHHIHEEDQVVRHQAGHDHAGNGLRSCILREEAVRKPSRRLGGGPCPPCHQRGRVEALAVFRERFGDPAHESPQSAGDLRVVQASGVL